MIRCLLAICIVIQPAFVNADHCRKAVIEQVVVKEVVKPVYALQYATIPLYSVAYSPVAIQSSYAVSAAPVQTVYQNKYVAPAAYVSPVYAQPLVQHQTTCEEKLARVIERLEKLESQPERLSLSAESPHVAILTAKCASCHSAETAATKGNAFTITQNGGLAELNSDARAKIAAALALGEMPKGKPKLSDQEFAAVMKWVKQPKP